LIKDGIESFTVGAHGGKVFHEHRTWKGEDFLVESAIRDEGRVIIIWNGMKGCMAFATFGFVLEQSLKEPVFNAAL
jgi:predicted methyltransferase MtxX (methanogen marker protein 4)